MSEAEVKSTAPDGNLPVGRKAPVVMAVAGVMGFAAGWFLGLFNPDARGILCVMGLVGGVTVGWLIGRFAMKASM